ncbi:MAG: class A sortase [Defluviitaleaceae bacterium]|nr:class A sortase [Defluviitaleaceae bacterium]
MKNFLINTLIFLLVLSGTLLVGWHFIQENVILYFTQTTIVPEEFEANLIAAMEADDDDVFDWEAVYLLDAFDWLQHVGIGDEVSPIGELIIPSIGTRLPIFHGVVEPNISIGAGTLLPGMVMGEGNYVLGSHWDPNPGIRFGGLDRVQVGDLLILRDGNYLYLYETIVGNNYIIEPYRWDIANYVEGRVLLTLFTCTPDGLQRVKVRGEFVEKLSVAELRDLVDQAAELEELAHLQALESLAESVDLETLVDVVETLDETTVPFPVTDVTLVTGGALVFASLIVGISSLNPKKNKK